MYRTHQLLLHLDEEFVTAVFKNSSVVMICWNYDFDFFSLIVLTIF